jgi:hypothetical protein
MRNKLLIIIYFLFYNFLSYIFIESFSFSNFVGFLFLSVVQLVYKDPRASTMTFIMFFVWLIFYYWPVFDLNIYYTSEQVFTDSNYYDYYARKFSNYDFTRIIIESDKTWQSVFVISFYSLVYKFLGLTILSPILINLFLIYLSFYFLKTRNIDKKNIVFGIYLLLPYMAFNLVVPGKDVLTVFFLSLVMSLFLNNYSKSYKTILKIIAYLLSGLNRPNSIPILLMFELNKILKAITINRLIILLMLVFGCYYFIGEQLSQYLELSTYIEQQREQSVVSPIIQDLLLPKNIFLFILATPIRLIAFLISPFPFFNLIKNSINSENSFVLFNFIFKFLSGIVWFFMIKHIYLNRKKFDHSLLLILISVPTFISTVHLVEGGRYRVLCDITLIWFFSYYCAHKKLLKSKK